MPFPESRRAADLPPRLRLSHQKLSGKGITTPDHAGKLRAELRGPVPLSQKLMCHGLDR